MYKTFSHMVASHLSQQRGRTAICLAFLGSKKGVLGYLLDKLPEERTETFVKVCKCIFD